MYHVPYFLDLNDISDKREVDFVIFGQTRVVACNIWSDQGRGLLYLVRPGLWLVIFGQTKVVACNIWSDQGGGLCASSYVMSVARC